MGQDFDHTIENFTKACRRASEWKDVYAGAAYATRVKQAIAELRKAIDRAEQHPELKS